MGQYYKIINLDKKEFLNPWKLSSGAKAWEQLANPWPGRALLALVLSSPKRRGGGDLGDDEIIGRWAGDRIIMVGDCSEAEDRPDIPDFGTLYDKTMKSKNEEPAEYKDVTELLYPLFGREFGIKVVPNSWGSGIHFEEDKVMP